MEKFIHQATSISNSMSKASISCSCGLIITKTIWTTAKSTNSKLSLEMQEHIKSKHPELTF